MSPDAPRPSSVRLAVTVLAPCALLFFFAYLAFATAGTLAFLSALGHGHQSRRETLSIIAVVMAAGLAILVPVTLALERWTFGPRATRVVAGLARPAATRLGTVVTAALLGLLGFLVWPEYRFRSTLHEARRADEREVRRAAIGRLGTLGDPRGLPLLKELATQSLPNRPSLGHDRGTAPYVYRSAAIDALGGIRGGEEVLLGLVGSPDPDVRAMAGRVLLRFPDDPEAWAAVKTLSAQDPDRAVRLAMTDEIATRLFSSPRREEAQALLRARLDDVDPRVRLRAAMRLGSEWKDPGGHDAAMAILMDTSLAHETRREAISTLGRIKDPRAAPLLARIAAGRADEGFVPAEQEEEFRRTAAEALGGLFPSGRPAANPPSR